MDGNKNHRLSKIHKETLFILFVALSRNITDVQLSELRIAVAEAVDPKLTMDSFRRSCKLLENREFVTLKKPDKDLFIKLTSKGLAAAKPIIMSRG